MINIPTYMIVIKDNPISEYYASIALPEWTRLGFNVEVFDAYTPTRQPEHFKLNFQPLTSKKYTKRNIKKVATPTEQGCWNSHAALWLKCIELKQPILILEHDCYPIDEKHITHNPKHSFVTFDSTGSGSYIITPAFAKLLWDVIKERGKIDHGPCGFVDYVIKKFRKTDVIAWDAKGVIYPCLQIYNEVYKSTISRYNQTEASVFAGLIETAAPRIVITENKKLSVSNIKNVIVE